jgi:hypothetical protein
MSTEHLTPGLYEVISRTPDTDPCIDGFGDKNLSERLKLYQGDIFDVTGRTEEVNRATYLKLDSVFRPAPNWKIWRPMGQEKLILSTLATEELKALTDKEARDRLNHHSTRRFLKKSIRDKLNI